MKYVSGIRPTGNIHLGNYLGAIKQWKELQKDNDTLFFVADLHQSYAAEGTNVWDTAACLHDLGIVNITTESMCKQDILSMYHELSFQVPVGWLNRMTQFKDKSQTESATLALLAYPVLMAADIFYFGGTHIPIGNDQLQHIELVNEIARVTGREKITPVLGKYPRIMSLKDGTKKMSKSDPDDYSRINVTDSPELIRDKVMKAKSANSLDDETPEMHNLWMMFKACGGEPEFNKWDRVKDFKEELAQLIIQELKIDKILA